MKVIEQATQVQVEECMRGLGYDYTNAAEDSQRSETEMAVFGPNGEYRRYGNVSMSIAEQYGFDVPDFMVSESDEGRASPTIDHSGQTLEDAQNALFGDEVRIQTPSGGSVPEFGCVGWAQQQVDPNTVFVTKEQAQVGTPGEQSGIAETAEWIKRTSFEQMLDTSEVIEVSAEWSTCMDLAGYPGEELWLVGSSDSQVAADDTEAAVTSIHCKEETDLIDVMVATEVEIQVGLIAQHEPELLERYEQLERVVESAVSSLENIG
ncbi:hypothetical protein [Nocardiopsis prasina]|uniref:hypothetical protein n=1 Tax=Nocardiopsis prasina TaxID=2015 RepID=UPI000362FD5D|nr:hypothetical protein [Nocardiopsis prasina]